MPLNTELLSTTPTRYLSALSGRKLMVGWISGLVLVAAVACSSAVDNDSVTDVATSAPVATSSTTVQESSSNSSAATLISPSALSTPNGRSLSTTVLKKATRATAGCWFPPKGGRSKG